MYKVLKMLDLVISVQKVQSTNECADCVESTKCATMRETQSVLPESTDACSRQPPPPLRLWQIDIMGNGLNLI